MTGVAGILAGSAASEALRPIEGGVIDLYMKRKRGEEAIEYLPGLAEKLEPILRMRRDRPW